MPLSGQQEAIRPVEKYCHNNSQLWKMGQLNKSQVCLGVIATIHFNLWFLYFSNFLSSLRYIKQEVGQWSDILLGHV